MDEVIALIGKCGYLFLDGDSNSSIKQMTGQRLLSKQELDAWRWELADRKSWLEAKKIPATFLIAPNKEAVYEDYLPENLSRGAVRPIHQIIAALEAAAFPFLWPEGELRAARSTRETYPTIDTHWNDFGALIAANAVLARFGVAEISVAECRFTPDPWRGDLGSKLSPPQIGVYWKGTHAAAPIAAAFDNRIVHAGHLVVYASACAQGGKIIVFGDSFGENLCWWLACRFRHVVFCHTTAFDAGLIARERPDCVLWEMVERFLIIPPAKMSGFDFAAVTARKLKALPAVERPRPQPGGPDKAVDETVLRFARDFEALLQEAPAPDAAALRAALAQTSKSERWNDYVELRRALFRAEPGDLANAVELAELLSQPSHPALNGEALALIATLLARDLDPTNDLKLRLAEARARDRRGEAAEALAVLEVAQAKHHLNYWPALRRAEILARIGRSAEALATIEGVEVPTESRWTATDIFDAYARIAEDLHVGAVDASARAFAPGRPMDNVLLVYMVKDEGDFIFQNLTHHHAMGFRRFVIIDNASTDATADLMKRFQELHGEATVFTIFDPVVGLYQGVKTNAAWRFAVDVLKKAGIAIDWVLPVDGDEFFCPGADGDLRELFDAADAHGDRVIAFAWRNAATSDLDTPFSTGDDLFHRFDLRSKRPAAHVFKVAARVDPALAFDEANHRVLNGHKLIKKTLMASSMGGFILHFHMGNIERMRRKVVNGGRAQEAAPNNMFATHWMRWYHDYQRRGDAAIVEIIDNYRRQVVGQR